MTGVAPIVSFSANVSERATRVSTPSLTGRQYRLAHGPSVQQSAASGAQAVSKLGVTPANLFKSTKVLKATPQGRRLGTQYSVFLLVRRFVGH